MNLPVLSAAFNEGPQPPGPAGVAQFPQYLVLDLPDTLSLLYFPDKINDAISEES